MAFEVPPLPYDYNALEPHIDEETMRLHHDKHHQAYVDKANAALEGTDWANESVEQILDDPRDAARGQADGPPQQRGRPREPLALLGDHEPGRRRRAGGRARGRDQRHVRLARRAEEGRQRRRREPLRLGLVVARPRRHRPRGLLDGEPGLPDHAVGRAAARDRRLGARVLPQVPEPPPRLSRGLVERRQLAGRRGALRARHAARSAQRPRDQAKSRRRDPPPAANGSVASSGAGS